MYEYGYFIAGQKIILGTIEENELETKSREINYDNKIDPISHWFVQKIQSTKQEEEK
jgi:hypothetical protein